MTDLQCRCICWSERTAAAIGSSKRWRRLMEGRCRRDAEKAEVEPACPPSLDHRFSLVAPDSTADTWCNHAPRQMRTPLLSFPERGNTQKTSAVRHAATLDRIPIIGRARCLVLPLLSRDPWQASSPRQRSASTDPNVASWLPCPFRSVNAPHRLAFHYLRGPDQLGPRMSRAATSLARPLLR